MAFNVDEILSKISSFGGLAKNNYFEVIIPKPSIVEGDNTRIPFLAESVTSPGISLQTDDVMHDGYSIVEKRPTQSAFAEIEIGFLLENDGRTHEFFENWYEAIAPFRDRGNEKFQMFAFPSDYMVDINIIMYRTDGEQLKEWTLVNAYPTILNGITLSWQSQNELARYPVTFTYEYWK